MSFAKPITVDPYNLEDVQWREPDAMPQPVEGLLSAAETPSVDEATLENVRTYYEGIWSLLLEPDLGVSLGVRFGTVPLSKDARTLLGGSGGRGGFFVRAGVELMLRKGNPAPELEAFVRSVANCLQGGEWGAETPETQRECILFVLGLMRPGQGQDPQISLDGSGM